MKKYSAIALLGLLVGGVSGCQPAPEDTVGVTPSPDAAGTVSPGAVAGTPGAETPGAKAVKALPASPPPASATFPNPTVPPLTGLRASTDADVQTGKAVAGRSNPFASQSIGAGDFVIAIPQNAEGGVVGTSTPGGTPGAPGTGPKTFTRRFGDGAGGGAGVDVGRSMSPPRFGGGGTGTTGTGAGGTGAGRGTGGLGTGGSTMAGRQARPGIPGSKLGATTIARKPGVTPIARKPGAAKPGARGAETPAGGTVAVAPPKLPALPDRPLLPDPVLAKAVEVTGVVQVGGSVQAIVKAPDEPTARYVGVGQRLSNGQVLVKRIELAGSEPLVVLEQSGVEVSRAVGQAPEGASPTPGAQGATS